MAAVGMAFLQQPAPHMAEASATHHPLDRESLQAQVGLQPTLQPPFGVIAWGKFAMGRLTGQGQQALGVRRP